MNATALEDLRKPHPDQARIDADSARLLQSSARQPGGRVGWGRPGPSAGTAKVKTIEADRPNLQVRP